MTINNRTLKTAADQMLADGLVKHASTIAFLFIGGQKLLNADVVQRLQQLIGAANLVRSTRAAWQAAVKADKELRANNLQFADDVKQTLRAMFSGDIQTLADFGLTARKRTRTKPATQVAAAAKAKATRTARGTKGKKQKAAIKATPAPQPAPANPPGASPPAAPPPVPPVAAPKSPSA